MFRTEGMPGFYRGFGSIMLTVIPANMCYFSGYEIGKRVTPPNMGLASDVTTAAIAQGIAGLVYCPIDIVKQTVQTASLMGRPGDTGHVSVLDAARSIWTHSGLRGGQSDGYCDSCVSGVRDSIAHVLQRSRA